MSTSFYNMNYQSKSYCLSIHDSTGQEEMVKIFFAHQIENFLKTHLRVLNYANTDFAFILYAANSITSFYNAIQKW
jgi:hypothetical protein